MAQRPVHAFGADELADHDATELARLVRDRVVSPDELAAAAIARAETIEPRLRALTTDVHANPLPALPGPFHGVPTYIKDNTPVAGWPTRHGSRAVPARPARADSPVAKQLRAAGFAVLGKTRLPEFGLNATTEFVEDEPTRNPWQPERSAGGSSGGAAALVASGVVPIAHGNDGGGSIRIPAACCGLVGLKPSRGRMAESEMAKLPINLVTDGVLTRTVRDTAGYLAAAEGYRRAPGLPPVGHVRGPGKRRLRVGLVLDAVTGAATATETRQAVEHTAKSLDRLGHAVEPIELPFGPEFVRDFLDYWGMLAFLISTFGRGLAGSGFAPSALEPFTLGLRRRYQRAAHRTPLMLARLSYGRRIYARMFTRYDVVLSPVLAHTAPPLGYLAPEVDVDELVDRLVHYVAFTPIANVTGAPAISLPAGVDGNGLPIGTQFSAAHGDERTLLELAYELEDHQPFPRIDETRD